MGDYMRKQLLKEGKFKKGKNIMAMRKARISIEFKFFYNPYILEVLCTFLPRRVFIGDARSSPSIVERIKASSEKTFFTMYDPS